MINKNYEAKTNKNTNLKLIFYILMIIYFAGLCSGSLFSLKNARNLSYVSTITGIENMLKNQESGFFAPYIRIYFRDILFLVSVLVFKYSGILRGMGMCIPFVTAFQNSCIYTCVFTTGTSVLNIIIRYIIKDTAVCFLTIIFCYIIFRDIVGGRYTVKKDVKKLLVYIMGISVIYIADIIIKIIFT